MNNNHKEKENMKEKRICYKYISAYILCTLMIFAGMPAKAQFPTTIELISGAPNAQIKAAMEKNGSLLLTELNNAQGEKRKLSLDTTIMKPDAKTSLLSMWEMCPFRCDELEIPERCLGTSSGGYQVRNIPVIMEPLSGKISEDERYQEIVLNFDAAGKISDLCFALKRTQYSQIMRNGLEVEDLRRRTMVIEFVEQFRTAYNRKDTAYLQAIFSDDALIITGKIVGRDERGIKYKYTSVDKQKYLKNLSNVFQKNERINVIFEDIKVNQRKNLPHIYGVRLVQHWNSSTYSDKGHLFLLWDFTDEEKPVIHVRTWQPYETPEKDIFNSSRFPDIK
jgi:hypothetical protein